MPAYVQKDFVTVDATGCWRQSMNRSRKAVVVDDDTPIRAAAGDHLTIWTHVETNVIAANLAKYELVGNLIK